MPCVTRAASATTVIGSLPRRPRIACRRGSLSQPWVRVLLSRDHFSADGTLLAAWASVKSFRPRGAGDGGGGDDADANTATGGGESGGDAGSGRNGTRDFHGERWSNETHASTTDARLYRKGKGKESRLCHLGHASNDGRDGTVRPVGARKSVEPERSGGGRPGQPGDRNGTRPGSWRAGDRSASASSRSTRTRHSVSRCTPRRTPPTATPWIPLGCRITVGRAVRSFVLRNPSPIMPQV